jgi:thermitase
MYYIANGLRHDVTLEPMLTVMGRARSRGRRALGDARGPADAALRSARLVNRLRGALADRFDVLGETQMLLVRTRGRGTARDGTLTFATSTVAVQGAHQSDLAWAASQGATVVEEGLEGKVLLKVPGDGPDGPARAFALAEQLLARGVAMAHPNFVRAVPRTLLSPQAGERHWAHQMIRVKEAWATTQGRKEIKVAVLDEGVDTSHPDLKPAVVAERDFIGTNGDSAMPAGDDAHGTACAGIVLSRNAQCPGVAPRVSLIAARIAMDDGQGHWIIDDFRTADAVDWCRDKEADVLSNSWFSGPPADVLTRAFARARTLGRNGLGAVIAVAAGNFQTAVTYPATIAGVIAVGASNQFDQRKTFDSDDGETNWGSCFGSALALLAPGVRICTTDIAGAAGYEPGDGLETFNGTSAATPHVAATAALMLSVTPGLRAAQVRQMILNTADKFSGQTGWTPELGHGRLNVAAAVAAAASPPPSPTIVGGFAVPALTAVRPRKRILHRRGRTRVKARAARAHAHR